MYLREIGTNEKNIVTYTTDVKHDRKKWNKKNTKNRRILSDSLELHSEVKHILTLIDVKQLRTNEKKYI